MKDASLGRGRPITVAQAWSAPIIFCLLGVGFAVWGQVRHPDASHVTAAIVLMIVVSAVSTALIGRGLVGCYQGAWIRGTLAIVVGIVLFLLLIVGLSALPPSETPGAQW